MSLQSFGMLQQAQELRNPSSWSPSPYYNKISQKDYSSKLQDIETKLDKLATDLQSFRFKNNESLLVLEASLKSSLSNIQAIDEKMKAQNELNKALRIKNEALERVAKEDWWALLSISSLALLVTNGLWLYSYLQ